MVSAEINTLNHNPILANTSWENVAVVNIVDEYCLQLKGRYGLTSNSKTMMVQIKVEITL